MDKMKNRRKRIFANKLHRTIFLLVFIAALLPTVITAISIYYLTFEITAEQIGIPETIAYNLFPAARKVITILIIATPAVILLILFFASAITHQIIGPFDRIIREIDESVAGARRGPIILRKTDKFRPLVDRINKLLDKLGNN